jgi:hypothetical protein
LQFKLFSHYFLPHKSKESQYKKGFLQSKSKIMSKFFEAPMAAQHACCDESTVLTDDSRATSCSDRSTNCGDQDSADHKVRQNPDRTNEETPTSASRYTSSQHVVLHPLQPAKVTGIQETAPYADMSGRSKMTKDGLALGTRPPLRVSQSDSALLPAARRKHTRPPLRENMLFKAPTLGGGPHQKQPKVARKALGSQQVLTRRESLLGLSPLRIPDFVPTIAKCKKQRRDKPPVETIHFQTHSFTGVMGDTSNTSALAQLRIVWYVD